MHVHHSNRRCLCVPRMPGSVKNPHNYSKEQIMMLAADTNNMHSGLTRCPLGTAGVASVSVFFFFFFFFVLFFN